jgi:hypothetical protein
LLSFLELSGNKSSDNICPTVSEPLITLSNPVNVFLAYLDQIRLTNPGCTSDS